MPDYNNNCIYKICCKDVNVTEIYVGHTTNFNKRKYVHEYASYTENHPNYSDYVYQFIRMNGDWYNWQMIKLYNFPCASKNEACIEERKCFDRLGAKLNTKKPYQTKEEEKLHVKWYKSQPKALAYAKSARRKQLKYENNQTEKRIEYNKKYKIDNKEKIAEKRKQKVNCPNCNQLRCKSSLQRHMRSNKCQSFKINQTE